MTVFTVARQLGSRGDWIAEQVASKLGYDLVDRRLVEEIKNLCRVDVVFFVKPPGHGDRAVEN